MSRPAKHTRALTALGGASLLHILAVLLWRGEVTRTPAQVHESTQFASVELLTEPSALLVATTGAKASSDDVPMALMGASDRLAGDPQEASNQHANAPGHSVGSPAPGVPGQESFTDRKDSSYRSKALWNTPGAGQMQHTTALPDGRRSPEALERQPDPGFSDSKRRPKQARAGQALASEGLSTQGQGGAPGDDGDEWFATDPRFDSAPQQRNEAIDGAVRTSAESPRSERGLLSAEASERGPAEQALDAPSRSSRRVASPFDLGAPSRGSKGSELGAAGKQGQSSGRGKGRGSAAQMGGTGNELATTEASRSIPYFNSMYRRIDKELRFPKNLALALEQGETVLKFQLDPQGRVLALEIHKSSGFKEFDGEARRAFLAASPFGPVPPALLREREALTVIAPYYFRNPLIR